MRWIKTVRGQLVNLNHVRFFEIVRAKYVLFDDMPEGHTHAVRARMDTTPAVVVFSGDEERCDQELNTILNIINDEE